ncbi:Na-translocating system protein MpsC family protein [Paenibacillus rigui]|uniref:DUF2294 domain-containing protein n=1 Tax=Paenibacillus rigui TaxID=554312 RepID=A0A229UP46_9BACL|nr:Na-translocating system protein MpsC family protein [Paenibacillus rigui]OXM85091.1 DUF2294 domain-containing protein [Paenibacillus rigui]
MKAKGSIGYLKQEIIKIYNSINQEIFGIGIRSQRLEVAGDKVYIFATHKRIPALKILDETNRSLTASVDAAVMDANKKMLKQKLEETLGLQVLTVLKDYDPVTEFSATIIVLEHPLEEG